MINKLRSLGKRKRNKEKEKKEKGKEEKKRTGITGKTRTWNLIGTGLELWHSS
jgi:hypothetical protein